jgi:hypothetical protein
MLVKSFGIIGRNKMKIPRLLLGIALLAGSVQAGQIVNGTAGLTNPGRFVDFSGHAFSTFTKITTQFSDEGIVLSPNLYYDGNGSTNCDGHTGNLGGSIGNLDASSHCLANFTNINSSDFLGNNVPLSIYFNDIQTSASFLLATNPPGGVPETNITAYLNGVQVDTMFVKTNLTQTNNFFGFTGESFNQVKISWSGAGPNGYLFGAIVSDLALGTPEPGTLALFGLGVAGIVTAARRRRKA